MKKNILFSIIIPVRNTTPYLLETLKHLKKQTLDSFETLVITDEISITSNPAKKRNLGAKMAQGKYLAFLDDDSFPQKNWLKNALKQIESDTNITAVCGPCLTPPSDSYLQKASGLVWSSYLGSGGAGTYRNSISKKRFVQDFPSVNLIVKKKDLLTIGGFNTHHWPGEDTILCLELVSKLNKKILYHPSIIVYHHRRKVIFSHLKQITRYATHRGNFARIYPKTSLKIGYLLPSFFFIYLLLLPFLPVLFMIPLLIYIFLLLITFFIFIYNHNKPLVSFLATITIPITHLYYGILFIFGFLKPQLNFQPHKVNQKTGEYIGG